MDFFDILWAIECGIILAFVTLWALLALGDIVYRRLNPPPPPFCDVDPRCHPAFAWGKDGRGWIGNVSVPTGQP